MREIVIQLPALDIEQNVEIEVKINGKKRRIQYRVEIIEWEPDRGGSEERVSYLRAVVQEHKRDWDLIQIGAPTDANIPIMFRKKNREF